MKKNDKDIRNWVTPEDLNVAPELLGLPLARPARRAGAMAIDLVVLTLLSAFVNAWLLAAGALAGVAWARAQRGQASRGAAALAGVAATLLLALGLWQALEPRSTGKTPSGLTLVVDADDKEDAAKRGTPAARRIAELESQVRELRQPPGWQRELMTQMREWRDEFGVGYGLSLLYFSLLPAWWGGQTLGKRLLRMRVVELSGKPLTPLRCLKRYGGYAAGLATGGIGLAQVLWDPNRQGLQDRTAHTVVIDLRETRRLSADEWQALAAQPAARPSSIASP